MLAHVALAIAPMLSVAAVPTPHTFAAMAPVEIWGSRLGDLRGIAVDADGHVWVADHGHGRVLRLDGPGAMRVVAHGLRGPVGLAFDRGGRLLVVEEDAGRVLHVTPHGTAVVVASGLEHPRWIAVGEDDTIYVSAWRGPAPEDHDRDADDLARPGVVLALRASERPALVLHGLREPEGVAVLDGVLYVAMRGRAPGDHDPILRVPLGPATRPAPPVGELDDVTIRKPVGLAVDAAGVVFVAANRLALPDDHVAGVVAKLGPAGAEAFAAGADEPQGLAFDREGNLYLTEGQGGRVVRFIAPRAPRLDPLPAWTREAALAVAGLAEVEARVEARAGEAQAHVLAADSGRFSLTVPLALNAADRIDVQAIGHDGAGLLSPSVSVDITQDAQPPTLVFDSPPTGAVVHGAVSVRATATDAGSQVASLELLANGQLLSATVSPSLPASAAVIAADWNSALRSDGVYTLAAHATDRAGNVTTVSRVITVDNTPPETEISGPDPLSADTRFTLSGADNLTPPTDLRFAWRLDGGAWSAYAATTTVTLADLAPGAHTLEAKARDRAGNEDPTPASVTFVAGTAGLAVTILEPAPGALVPAGAVLVRGTVQPSDGDVGVTVNGAPAWVQRGGNFTGLVPIDGATTHLEARAGATDGRSGQTSVPIVVDSTAPATPSLLATPRSGIAPLAVRVSLPQDPRIAAVDLDADGDGAIDYSGDQLTDYAVVFTQPGVYAPRAVITDTDGAHFVSRAIVQVFDRTTLDSLLRAQWSAMKTALRQANIAEGLRYIVERRRPDYAVTFGLMASDLPAIDSVLGDIALVDVRNASATYEMRRVDDNIERSFLVRFAVDADGVWRLEAF